MMGIETPKSVIDKLEIFSDPKFKFDPKKHRYTYDGEEFTPVTTFISRFHKPFEQDYWSKEKAKERGIEQKEILREWQEINDRANFVGTATHNWIENYFNREYQELPTDQDIIDRINKFNKIYAKQLHKLIPVKAEQFVFSKKYKIAGTIDALFIYHGKLFIVDYKTNKNFTTEENVVYREKLLYPFENYTKHHLNEYSIQVSLYSLILKEYGINVNGGIILHIGPGDEEARLYHCVNMVDKLEEYLQTTLK